MPDAWRKRYIRTKKRFKNCTNYRDIKLISHTMEFVERINGMKIKT